MRASASTKPAADPAIDTSGAAVSPSNSGGGLNINPDTGRRQDIGAQSIVPLLEIQPGMTVLDLCAGSSEIRRLWDSNSTIT